MALHVRDVLHFSLLQPRCTMCACRYCQLMFTLIVLLKRTKRLPFIQVVFSYYFWRSARIICQAALMYQPHHGRTKQTDQRLCTYVTKQYKASRRSGFESSWNTIKTFSPYFRSKLICILTCIYVILFNINRHVKIPFTTKKGGKKRLYSKRIRTRTFCLLYIAL